MPSSAKERQSPLPFRRSDGEASGPSRGGVATYNSFSGADINVIFYVGPDEALHGRTFGESTKSELIFESLLQNNEPANSGRITENGGFIVAGQLQTLTVSSSRSVSPVRVLGESAVRDYTAGSRTIAGTMIFTVLYRDAFVEMYRRARNERFTENFYLDMIPPLTIIIRGENELGQAGMQVIDGVRLVNYGTTYSIDDLYTEASYTYVATSATPFLPRETLKRTISDGLAQQAPPASRAASGLRQQPKRNNT